MKDKIKKIVEEKKKDEVKTINSTKQKIKHKLQDKINDLNSNIGKIKGSRWL